MAQEFEIGKNPFAKLMKVILIVGIAGAGGMFLNSVGCLASPWHHGIWAFFYFINPLNIIALWGALALCAFALRSTSSQIVNSGILLANFICACAVGGFFLLSYAEEDLSILADLSAIGMAVLQILIYIKIKNVPELKNLAVFSLVFAIALSAACIFSFVPYLNLVLSWAELAACILLLINYYKTFTAQ